MPGPLSPNYVYEMRVRMAAPTVYNQEVSLVKNYVYSGATAGLTIRDALQAFKTSFRAAVLPAMCSTQKVARYEARSIYSRTPKVPPPPPPGLPNKLAYLEFYPEEGLAGTDVGGRAILTLLPPTDSISIESRTDNAGRAAFGINRIGFLPPVDVDQGNLTPAAVAIWDLVKAWMQATIVIGVGGDTLEPVIFNKTAYLFQPVVLPNPSSYAKPITQTNLAVTLGTQLTRKRPIRRPGY